MTAGCPTSNALMRMVEGTLPVPELAAVCGHLDECASCGELAAELARALVPGPGQRPRELQSMLPFDAKAVADRAGDRIGRYHLLRVIGRGGMGLVYAAYDEQLEREVALKVIRPDLLDGPQGAELKRRFLREARALAKLSHPNVIAVHDAGEDNDRLYIACELLPGHTARELRAAPWRQVVAVFRQAALGLAAAHAAGLVHRDIKPANILVGSDGRVKLGDFGLVSEPTPPAAGPVPVPLTATGQLVGTPRYLAPEQRRLPADARSDQFAFCVALYETLFGHAPFQAATPADELAVMWAGQLREPDRTKVPARLRRVLRRGLSADSRQRFDSMTDLARALAAASRPRPAWRLAVGPLLGACLLALTLLALDRLAATRAPAERFVATPSAVFDRVPASVALPTPTSSTPQPVSPGPVVTAAPDRGPPAATSIEYYRKLGDDLRKLNRTLFQHWVPPRAPFTHLSTAALYQLAWKARDAGTGTLCLRVLDEAAARPLRPRPDDGWEHDALAAARMDRALCNMAAGRCAEGAQALRALGSTALVVAMYEAAYCQPAPPASKEP